MSQIEARVSWWSHKDKAVQVHNVAELDRVIDSVIESECIEYPTVIEVEAYGYVLSMAVGLPDSFVQITPDSNLPPYLVAIAANSADDEDTFDFYFQGFHHTEIPRRNILEFAKARELCRAFVVTGSIPKEIEWEEV